MKSSDRRADVSVRLPRGENLHVFLPLLFPLLSGCPAWLSRKAEEKGPPPPVIAWFLWSAPHAVPPGTALSTERRTQARRTGPAFDLAPLLPPSSGEGTRVKSPVTHDLLNPGQLLQGQEKQSHHRGATSSPKWQPLATGG